MSFDLQESWIDFSRWVLNVPDLDLETFSARIAVLPQEKCDSLAQRIVSFIGTEALPEFMPPPLSDRVKRLQSVMQSRTRSSELLEQVLVRLRADDHAGLAGLGALANLLPPPVGQAAAELARQYDRVTADGIAEDDRWARLAHFHSCVKQVLFCWPHIAAALALGLRWAEMPRLRSHEAIELLKIFQRLGSQRDDFKLNVTFGTLAALASASLRMESQREGRAQSHEPKGRAGNKKKKSTGEGSKGEGRAQSLFPSLAAEPTDSLIKLIGKRNTLAHGTGQDQTEGAWCSAVLDLQLPRLALNLSLRLAEVWRHWTFLVPRAVDGTGEQLHIVEASWVDDNGTWQHGRICPLALKKGDDVYFRVDPWTDAVQLRHSPFVLQRKLIDSGASGSAQELGVPNGWSLYPFARVTRLETDDPTIQFFNGFTQDKSSVKGDSPTLGAGPVKTVKYLSLGRLDRGEWEASRFDDDRPLRSLGAFLKDLEKQSGGGLVGQLAVKIQELEGHEYLLYGRKFVGRERELQALDAWAKGDGGAIYCLHALGGEGKSALAAHWLQRQETRDLLQAHHFQGALWCTFYEEGFSIVDFARESLQFMHAPTIGDENSLLRAVLDELARKKYLFVLDGFERRLECFQYDEAEIQAEMERSGGELPARYRRCHEDREEWFLRKLLPLPPDGSRLLFTSRFAPEAFLEATGRDQAHCRQLAALPSDWAKELWWRESQREHPVHYDDAEDQQVSNVIEKIDRHPLVIRLLTRTVGDRHLADWLDEIRSEQDSGVTAFDDSFRTSAGDTPNVWHRRSQAIYYCGRSVDGLRWEILSRIEQSQSSTPLAALLSARDLLHHAGVLSPIEPAAYLRAQIEALERLGWIGRSTRSVDLHPLVREYIRLRSKADSSGEQREDVIRGTTRNLQLSVGQLKNLTREAGEILHNGESDRAWKLLKRRWTEILRIPPVAGQGSTGIMRETLQQFLPDGAGLPLLSQRREQADLLLKLGSLQAESALDDDSRHALQWAEALAHVQGDPKTARDCRHTLIWTAIYRGRLSEALQNLNALPFTDYREIWKELCFSLLGRRGTSLGHIQPTADALPEMDDRRWLYQTMAEIAFWRDDFQDIPRWLDLLSAAGRQVAQLRAAATEIPQRGQLAWEYWIQGAYHAERWRRELVAGGHPPADSFRQARVLLQTAQREAEGNELRIVEALSVALQGDLLAHDLLHAAEAGDLLEHFSRVAAWVNYPFARCLALLGQARLALASDRTAAARSLAAEAWQVALLNDDGDLFALGLRRAAQLLEEAGATETLQALQACEVLDRITLRPPDAAAPPATPTADTAKTVTSAPAPADDGHGKPAGRDADRDENWEAVANIAQELTVFRPLVNARGKTGRDFHQALLRTAREHKTLDPVIALIEMDICDMEPRNAQPLPRFDSIAPFADTLRIHSLEDWRVSDMGGLDLGRRIDAAVAQHKNLEIWGGKALVPELFIDAMRILGVPHQVTGTAKRWYELVVEGQPAHELLSSQRRLIPLLEALLLTERGLREFVDKLRLPNDKCYRVRFLRWLQEDWSQTYDRMNLSALDKPETLVSLKLRCGWQETTGSARKWWEAFERENEHRRSLIGRLLKELAERQATITEFFLAYVYSNTDNIQANLDYLDYRRTVAATKHGTDPQTAAARVTAWLNNPPDHFTDSSERSHDDIRRLIAAKSAEIDVAGMTQEARAWWTSFCRANAERPAILLRLCEELIQRQATITEFVESTQDARTDNLQARLSFLNYARLKNEEQRKREEAAAAARRAQLAEEYPAHRDALGWESAEPAVKDWWMSWEQDSAGNMSPLHEFADALVAARSSLAECHQLHTHRPDLTLDDILRLVRDRHERERREKVLDALRRQLRFDEAQEQAQQWWLNQEEQHLDANLLDQVSERLTRRGQATLQLLFETARALATDDLDQIVFAVGRKKRRRRKHSADSETHDQRADRRDDNPFRDQPFDEHWLDEDPFDEDPFREHSSDDPFAG